MNDIVETARTARTRLASALELLQSPQAEHVLDTVAEPVARAMGALHGIESSAGQSLPTGGPLALAAVRQALEALQSVKPNPTLDDAAGQVAGSLGLIHKLAQQAAAPVPAAPAVVPAAPVAASGFGPTAPQPSAPPNPNFAKTTPSVAPPPEPNFARTAPSVTPSMSAAKPAAAVSPAPAPAPAGVGAFDKTALVSRSPVAHIDHTQPEQPQREAPAPAAVARPSQTRPVDSKHAAAPQEGPRPGTLVVEANLGAHSPTNFYKGLSGNDVVADGGLFVATYQIPAIGTQVWLRVSMPGGYDFEAGGVVRWSRSSGAGDAPPGFGASLLSLSQEARQLIQRYVRNREPLFHDDL